jgi:hypothetical protein
MSQLRDWIAAAAAADAELTISVSHLGDPFASPLYRSLLFDPAPPPKLRLHLFSNGLLLPECWPQMRGWHGRVQGVSQSIDAASPTTYKTLRRGGTWRQLEKSLRFISALRRRGEISHWHWGFVVQADNWREMPAFVARAEDYGADAVGFSLLRQWHMPADEYRRKNLSDPAHPEHAAYVASLADPVFQNPLVADGVFRPAVHSLLQEAS